MIDSQNMVVGLVVTIAVMYLAYRAFGHFRRKKSGCSVGCSSCPSTSASDTTVVPFDQLAASARSLRSKS